MICPHCGKETDELPKEHKSIWFTSTPIETIKEKKKKAKRKPKIFNELDWKLIRGRILRRDKHECVRCKTKNYLSVHHIVPRDNGGGDNDANLITLCGLCHDYAEVKGYRYRWQIEESGDANMAKSNKKQAVRNRGDDVAYRPAWHEHVYGGNRGSKKRSEKPNYHRFYGIVYEVSMLAMQGQWMAGLSKSVCEKATAGIGRDEVRAEA